MEDSRYASAWDKPTPNSAMWSGRGRKFSKSRLSCNNQCLAASRLMYVEDALRPTGRRCSRRHPGSNPFQAVITVAMKHPANSQRKTDGPHLPCGNAAAGLCRYPDLDPAVRQLAAGLDG